MLRRLLICCLLLSGTHIARCAEDSHPTIDGPLPPQRAHESFELEKDLRVDLVAGEPLVVAPVAMAFDARGRLFVVENRGYPTGPKEGEPPMGKIVLLEDENGDGRMDRRVEFADNLTFPNGILPWKDGVIVTCAPDILWLRDTNGDGREDVREVLFTGFATTGSTQLRVSHPTLAPDGWIYVANGLSGGKIISPKFPDAPPVELKKNTFRFRPDFSSGEAAGGPAQFGLCFDDYNRMFVCYNRVQVQHVVFHPGQLANHPLGFSDMLHNCPAETVNEPLKGHGAAAKLYPISQNITTADSHAGTFTAACGVTLVRGSNLPSLYEGGVLSCDPTANLVHFDKLTPNGVTFSATRLPGTTEFLRSSDSWFRPVFLTFGPDGALYVCDMYRKTIEHPDYLPVEIRKHTDFESGREMGRIWRVSGKDDLTQRWNPTPLHDKSVEELLRVLAAANSQMFSIKTPVRCTNGWLEDTIQRLLFEKGDDAISPVLDAYSGKARIRVPPMRMMYFLDYQNALSDQTLRAALLGGRDDVRKVAFELAAKRLAKDETWLKDILLMLSYSRPDLEFSFLVEVKAASAKAKQWEDYFRRVREIGFKHHEDRWFRAALWNALAEVEPLKAGELFEQGYREKPRVREFNVEYGRLLAALDKEGTALKSFGFTWAYLTKDVRAEILLGIAQGTKNEQADALQKSIVKFLNEVPDSRAKHDELREKKATLELMAYTTYDIAGNELKKTLESKDPTIQLLAIRSLGKLRDERALQDLFHADRWEHFPANLREEAVNAAMTSEVGIVAVLNAIESNNIEAHLLDAFRRRQLLQHKNDAIRARAEKLFGQVQGDRAKVYEEYKTVADEQGNAFNGHLVFKKNCANCHRLNREGTAVGPDLFGIRNQPKAAILLHLLAPDHEITPGFTAYQVVTKDGRNFTGLLAGETPATVTLRLPLGKEETIAREDIEEFKASKLSLMPQGLEKTVTRPEFADLLAYLKGEREVPPDAK